MLDCKTARLLLALAHRHYPELEEREAAALDQRAERTRGPGRRETITPGRATARSTSLRAFLDVPGVDHTYANGINDSGQIVGSYYDGSRTHGFLLDHGSYTTLDVPGSYHTEGRGINDSGQIVGVFFDAAGIHGFLFDHGSYATLDVPGANNTFANGVNDSGQIVGWYEDPVGKHGFLLDQGRYTTLDPPGWRNVPGQFSGLGLSVAFSPDGRWVASAAEDCTVRLWDAATLEWKHTFRGHTGPIRSLAFSRDGRRLVSGSQDRTAKVWDLTWLKSKQDSN